MVCQLWVYKSLKTEINLIQLCVCACALSLFFFAEQFSHLECILYALHFYFTEILILFFLSSHPTRDYELNGVADCINFRLLALQTQHIQSESVIRCWRFFLLLSRQLRPSIFQCSFGFISATVLLIYPINLTFFAFCSSSSSSSFLNKCICSATLTLRCLCFMTYFASEKQTKWSEMKNKWSRK